MIAALILLIVIAAGGGVAYLLDRHRGHIPDNNPPDVQEGGDAPLTVDTADEGVCCGMHITCEKDSLSTAVSTEIIYYDDEELDIYSTRTGTDYTPEETEQFRDILLTLLPDDIAGWARSLQLRHIPLPPEVNDELLLIVTETRAARNN